MSTADPHLNPAPGTLTVYSDIACPWATVALAGLRQAAAECDLPVRIDHRAFALELVNSRPTPRRTLDAELAVLHEVDPTLGPWQGRDSEYPVTSLLALEAVQAAKGVPTDRARGLEASDQLDAALRHAFYTEGRCISLLPVILDVAAECPEVDVDALATALHIGMGRADVVAQTRSAVTGDAVKGSPHVFASGGMSWHNPGMTVHWTDGRPVLDGHDPSAYAEIVAAAAGAQSTRC